VDEPTRPTIPVRPLFSGHLLPPEERERKFREFVKFVIENQELSGHPLPPDHPLREWLPREDAA
jgi:hypothetical protein